MNLKDFWVRRVNGDLFNVAVNNIYLDPKDCLIFSKCDLLQFWIDQLEMNSICFD
jgi:hypothetical protein